MQEEHVIDMLTRVGFMADNDYTCNCILDIIYLDYICKYKPKFCTSFSSKIIFFAIDEL